MARYILSKSDNWKRADLYEGRVIFLREDSYGVWVSAVEGFRGGEAKCSGEGARNRALNAARLRIDDMNNVE